MADKPASRSGYAPEQSRRVRQMCLYVATILGNLLPHLVVVGGLVPSLLIDPADLPEEGEAHVGTLDLDLALDVGLLDHGRYHTVAERLRSAGFTRDENHKGNQTRQRWCYRNDGKLTIDFLIAPTREDHEGGKLRDLEPDFAAVIMPGLQLAFDDRREVTLSGTTLRGEAATREIQVCGPGAFIVLKALAFDLRGENKDAYDLFYMLQNYGSGVADVAEAMRPLMSDEAARKAVEILRRDFLSEDALGPRRAADFLTRGRDEDVQADVVGLVAELLDHLGA